MEAIVLAGGFGTRLQSVVSDIAKPMASINGKPFLAYLVEYLADFGIRRIILSVGHKKESIQSFFQEKYQDIEFVYSVEERALGTGGAIKKALQEVKAQKVFVLNGDSFFQVDLALFSQHMQKEKIALALKPMQNFDRYGSIVLEHGKIVSFEEKKKTKDGLINGGVYIITKEIFQDTLEDVFSFESFLQEEKDIGGYVSDGYFIDIGIPSDYWKAQQDFKELF